MVVDRNVANVENLKNHPSILIWSMGNECGGGSNLRAAEKAVRALDSTRPTHYEAFGEGANNPASIDSHMYTQPGELERIAKSETLTKPMYLCEYAHAMNNSMGALGEYNDLFDKYPALMGGAIWEWEDQGLWNRRDPAHPYLAYGGGFGEKPNDGYFIHKGVVFSDRSPKPHFPEVKRAYQWIAFKDDGGGKVTVKNRFNDTDLSKYDFSWSLVSERGPVAKGTIPGFSLAPGAEKTLTLDLPKDFDVDRDARYLNVAASLRSPERWAEKGYEIANAQFAVPVRPSPLPSGGERAGGEGSEMRSVVGHGPSASDEARIEQSGELKLTQDAGGIRVSGDGFAVSFDKTTGTIAKLEENGRNLLLPGGGPKPHLWRAQHRNDDGWAAGGWKAADLMDLKPEVLALDAKVDERYGHRLIQRPLRGRERLLRPPPRPVHRPARRHDPRGQRPLARGRQDHPRPHGRADAPRSEDREAGVLRPGTDGELHRPQARLRSRSLREYRHRADDALSQAPGVRQPRGPQLARPQGRRDDPHGGGGRCPAPVLRPPVHRRADGGRALPHLPSRAHRDRADPRREDPRRRLRLVRPAPRAELPRGHDADGVLLRPQPSARRNPALTVDLGTPPPRSL